ncbi:hypothetical protein [Pseudolysinimonas sp.]|uniref:hypothetical protein n=1 Tax=Pseudolysinimonas sp. TaxID=2680009 RepID=UPI003F813A01
MTFTVPRPLARLAAAALTAGLAAVVLAGCSSEPKATATPTCDGHMKVVLLGDDSATTVVPFDPADSPKEFGIPASPAPACAYKTVQSVQDTTTPTTTTHRTYLYVGLSTDEAQKLIAALGATAGKQPWSIDYANVPAPSSTPAPYALQTASWNYNAGGTAGQDHGSMAYAFNAPINPGVATQAGIAGDPNVLRIETEITSPTK